MIGKNYRFLWRLKDYDGGWVSIYGAKTRTGFNVILTGEYGDEVEEEGNDLRACVESACTRYYGLPCDMRNLKTRQRGA